MKKTMNIFLSLVLGLSFFISAFAQPTPTLADEPPLSEASTEILYLSDTLGTNDGKSVLYQVALIDDDIDKAVLTPVAYASSTGVFPLNHLDAIAASPYDKSAEPILTMYTCHPIYSTEKRLVVISELIEEEGRLDDVFLENDWQEKDGDGNFATSTVNISD